MQLVQLIESKAIRAMYPNQWPLRDLVLLIRREDQRLKVLESRRRARHGGNGGI